MKILPTALIFACALAPAESINPPTKPQTAPMSAQEKKNLDMVINWWRDVPYAGHYDLAPKYQAADYIQHNPNANTGRDGFIAFFKSLNRPQVNPIPKQLPADQMPVVMGARGDYVWLIFEHEDKDPRNQANTYHYNSFDVLRIQNGKVQEHWDSAQKMKGSGSVNTGVSPKPPMQWNTGKLSAAEEKTLAMATEELKDMLQYGHLELADKTMDPGYIQHNPNVPQGRDGFKQFMSRVPGRTPTSSGPKTASSRSTGTKLASTRPPWVPSNVPRLSARRMEDYSLSSRQSTYASDSAVDTGIVLVRANDRLHNLRRRSR